MSEQDETERALAVLGQMPVMLVCFIIAFELTFPLAMRLAEWALAAIVWCQRRWRDLWRIPDYERIVELEMELGLLVVEIGDKEL